MNQIKSKLLSISLAGLFLSALPASAQPSYFPTAYNYPSNTLQLGIAAASQTNLNLLVQGTQSGVPYQLLSKQSLTDPAWASEQSLAGSVNTNLTPADVTLSNRSTLFLKVQSPQISGLKLWLAADLFTRTNNTLPTNNTLVGVWPDISGNSNSAVQNTSGNQPLYLTNIINGHPALQFNGTSSAMLLPNVSGTNNFTIFVVAQTSLGHQIDTESTNNGVAGTTQDGHQYILFDNKTADTAINNGGAGISVGTNGISAYEYEPTGGPSQATPLAVYNGVVGSGASVLEAVYNARQPYLYLNGVLVRTGLTSVRTNELAPREIGGDSYGYFQGYIAEALIFNRVLSDAERLTVETYLNNKYAVAGILPAAPTNLIATAVSSNQVSLTWTSSSGATEFLIERKLGSGGTYQQIATVAATTTSYFDTGLSSGTYYYRVRAGNLTGDSAYSNETNATTTAGTTLPLGNLGLWLEADSGINKNASSQVSQWTDQSGNANNALPNGSTAQPTYITNAINGLPALQFNGTNSTMLVPYIAGSNNFSIFIVAQTSLPHHIDTESTNNGVAGTTQDGHQYILFDNKALDTDVNTGGAGISVGTNGISAYEFESTGGPNEATPTAVYSGSVGAAPALVEAIYNARQPYLYLNGTLVHTGLTSPRPNVIAPREIGGDSYGYLQGNIAEVLIFNRNLSDAERQTVETYLAAKYALP